MKKTINLDKIATLSSLHERIVKIENEMREIDSHAKSIVVGESKFELQLDIKNVTEFDKAKIKAKFENQEQELSYSAIFWHPLKTKEKDENISTLKYTISESTSLQIFGIMLAEKMKERKELIEQIQQLYYEN